MFQCSYSIIMELINSYLLKLELLDYFNNCNVSNHELIFLTLQLLK